VTDALHDKTFKWPQKELKWSELSFGRELSVACPSDNDSQTANFSVTGVSGIDALVPLPRLRVAAPLVFENLLPISMKFSIQNPEKESESRVIAGGEETECFFVPISKETLLTVLIPELGYTNEIPVRLLQTKTITLISPLTKLPLVINLL